MNSLRCSRQTRNHDVCQRSSGTVRAINVRGKRAILVIELHTYRQSNVALLHLENEILTIFVALGTKLTPSSK